MKKLIFIAALAVALAFTSCSTVKHTATDIPVATEVVSNNTADLVVSPKKISYTFTPTKANRRAGKKAVIKTAVAQALKANGNADVLVGFQYEIKESRNFFGHKSIKYVIVEGYPATYTNVRPIK